MHQPKSVASPNDILKLGLASYYYREIVRRHVKNGATKQAARKEAMSYIQMDETKEWLDIKYKENIRSLENEAVIAELKKANATWRVVCISLISSAIAALIGPIVWGLLVHFFGIGQTNIALPENTAKAIVKKLDDTSSK